MASLPELLEATAAQHKHLCPRQVLGVRMGLLGGRWLGLEVPRDDKRLIAFVETDGCFADGITAATGCRVGKRTLRVVDFGKVAVTFADIYTERAVRIAPHPLSRERAKSYAPDAPSRWHAQLQAYQIMPDEELMIAQAVVLTFSLEKFVSKAGYRVTCAICGEEVINEREVLRDGLTLCRACAGERYYQIAEARAPLSL
ncbi:MAG: FmdE family protein [Anaerolineae bacterium]|nr:FmdE family protein [Anaerolineae bacterium]MDW8098502.1 FmdE family protein [Anaerolineae bacterium]